MKQGNHQLGRAMEIMENYTLQPVVAEGEEVFAELYMKWANDPEVTRYLNQGHYPIGPSSSKAIYEESMPPDSVVYYICCGEQKVGVVGLYTVWWASRAGEFRIMLGERDHWGKGLGKRCLDVMMEMAFYKYNFHKFWLGYNISNERARVMYEKSGLGHRSVWKEHHYKNGVYSDIVYLSIFRHEYDALRKEKGLSLPEA